MKSPTKLADVFCCPRCAGPLVDADGGFRCEKCAGRYPIIGGIPCLIEDPTLWRTVTLRRLDDYSSGIEARVQELEREAEAPELLPRTRKRLLRIAAAFAQQLEEVASLFEPLDQGSDPLIAAAIPSRPEMGPQGAFLE